MEIPSWDAGTVGAVDRFPEERSKGGNSSNGLEEVINIVWADNEIVDQCGEALVGLEAANKVFGTRDTEKFEPVSVVMGRFRDVPLFTKFDNYRFKVHLHEFNVVSRVWSRTWVGPRFDLTRLSLRIVGRVGHVAIDRSRIGGNTR